MEGIEELIKLFPDDKFKICNYNNRRKYFKNSDYYIKCIDNISRYHGRCRYCLYGRIIIGYICIDCQMDDICDSCFKKNEHKGHNYVRDNVSHNDHNCDVCKCCIDTKWWLQCLGNDIDICSNCINTDKAKEYMETYTFRREQCIRIDQLTGFGSIYDWIPIVYTNEYNGVYITKNRNKDSIYYNNIGITWYQNKYNKGCFNLKIKIEQLIEITKEILNPNIICAACNEKINNNNIYIDEYTANELKTNRYFTLIDDYYHKECLYADHVHITYDEIKKLAIEQFMYRLMDKYNFRQVYGYE